ncbi:MAG: hypothetical protein IT336_05265, partial [Thermomicrobiales bacterium]|nr:hypothetical protein [Thermomicrobiales bacterium]
MDGKDFDAFTRRLAAGCSRRGLLRAGLAFAGAAVGHRLAGAEVGAATLRSPGQICRTNGECASGNCGPKDRTGRSRCLCGGPGDCPQPPAGDPCRSATCSPNGQCTIVVNTGTPCGDGNACIQNPTCQADGTCVGTPVVCTPLDQCHVAGTCDPATGLCSNPAADFGTLCDDGNACTTGDKCVLGECIGTSIICEPVNDPGGCWIQPVCDPTTGICTQATPKSSGTPCDDGNLCTTSTCDGAGTCVGVPISCGGAAAGTCPQKCDPATGQCVAGGNGDWCVPSVFGQCETGICQDGGCVAVPAQAGASCFFSTTPPNPCLTGVCSESGDCVGVSVADGTTCTPATALGECQTGVCQTGVCVALSVPDGTLCGSDI